MGKLIEFKPKAKPQQQVLKTPPPTFDGPELAVGQIIGYCPCGGWQVAGEVGALDERAVTCRACGNSFDLPAALEMSLSISMQRLNYVYDQLGRTNPDPNSEPAWKSAAPRKRTRRGT